MSLKIDNPQPLDEKTVLAFLLDLYCSFISFTYFLARNMQIYQTDFYLVNSVKKLASEKSYNYYCEQCFTIGTIIINYYTCFVGPSFGTYQGTC